MAIQFKSPAAAISEALMRYMRDFEIQRRQSMEDALRQREFESDQEARRADLAERQRTAQRQTRQDEITEGDRAARIYGPDADLTPEVSETLRKAGYQVEAKKTLPARTIAVPGNAVPGSEDRTPASMIPAFGMPSNTYARRGETHPEQQARQQIERAQAERDEDRDFRWDTAREAERARAAQAGESNAVRLEIAQGNAVQRAEAAAARLEQARTTADINRARLELQQALADLKIDETNRGRRTEANAVAIGRSEVRELAQSLIDDDALDAITGPIEGRRETFWQGRNVEALRRLNQLVSKLSLEGRGKLKGQGAVSDFEGRTLAAAMSAIDRAAGPDIVRKHLKEIVGAFEGDAPRQRQGTSAGPAVGTRRTVNGVPAIWDGQGWLPEGGR